MKKLMIVLCLVLIPSMVSAETMLTTPEMRPTIDRFNVDKFSIDVAIPMITIQVDMGYTDGSFKQYRTDTFEITDMNIGIRLPNGRYKGYYLDDENDEMLSLPPDYRQNPATKILQEINAGAFGGEATLKEYIELIVKTLLKL